MSGNYKHKTQLTSALNVASYGLFVGCTQLIYIVGGLPTNSSFSSTSLYLLRHVNFQEPSTGTSSPLFAINFLSLISKKKSNKVSESWNF
ncbi:hypothetical protein L1887_31433 [Cichorium endivia]|nr:hypothetical protein L1887_31433 [Cichorium endivia]